MDGLIIGLSIIIEIGGTEEWRYFIYLIFVHCGVRFSH
jgi:hypothetical protein